MRPMPRSSWAAAVLCIGFLDAMPADSQGGARVGAQFDCPADECHIAPVAGSGGFVGGVANSDLKISYAVTCGASTIATAATVDDRGGVAVLFSEDNGFACPEGGRVEIRGLADGGWYWLVDFGRAAAAPLIAKDTIGTYAVKPWDPDSLDIDMIPVKHGYATLARDAVSGSMSLLPHVLPAPRTPPPPPCGPVREDGEWVQNSTDCVLGGGGTAIAIRYGNVYVRPGTRSVTVHRPGFGNLSVILSLWGDGSGHISTATPVVPLFGHYLPEAAALPASSWSVETVGAAPGAVTGVTLSGRTLTISPDDRYCEPRSTPVVNIPITVEVSASATPSAVPVAPPIRVDDASVAATRRLVIACPGAPANQGAELAPRPPRRRPG